MFFRIKDLNTQANLCKNVSFPASTKNDYGTIAMRKNGCNANGTNNSTNKKMTT